MIKTAIWFERKFEFDLPAWMFPNLVERLRGTPARVEEKVRAWPAELLTQRVNDAWSVQEHVGHLIDLEPLWYGRLDDFDSHAELLRAADLTNRRTHEANHNAAPLEILLKAFRMARHEFVKRIEPYDEASVVRTSLHPRLKTPLRVIDHIQFVCEHDDHHLAKMSEIIAIVK